MKNNKHRSIHSAASLLMALPLLFGALPPAQAQVSVGVGISLPGVNIGINLPAYPQLVRVPGYPVYYAPNASGNYFFYDGLYWVCADDNWYSSDWYNGPWSLVEPAYVPVFVLRVPVRYYRRPPVYFRSWRADAPPRWGDHWGRDWESRHRGWDRWDRRSVPAPAPLPVYQRRYTGDRYPQAPERQRELRAQNYRYQPRETVSRQQFQRPAAPAPAVAPPSREARPDRRPDRGVPPPPREAQRPQAERPPGRPERAREQAAPPPARQQAERMQPPPRQPPERAQAQAPAPRPQPERGGPQGEPRGQHGGGRDANPGHRGGDAQPDRGRGGPPEGRGRDKDK